MVFEVVFRRTTCKKCCVLKPVIAYGQLCLGLYLGSMRSIFFEMYYVALKWTSCEYHLRFLSFFVFVRIRVSWKCPKPLIPIHHIVLTFTNHFHFVCRNSDLYTKFPFQFNIMLKIIAFFVVVVVFHCFQCTSIWVIFIKSRTPLIF